MLSDFDLEGKNKLQKAFYYLKYYGAAYTCKKALRKLGVPVNEESAYMAWCRRGAASKAQLSAQKKDALSEVLSFVIVSEADVDEKEAGWKRQTCRRVSYAKISEETTLRILLQAHAGDYFVFSGKEIRVSPEYLYEISKAACQTVPVSIGSMPNEHEKPADLIYTDEDNCVGNKRFRPFFKPDASMQMLLNFPYLGRCFVIRRSLLEKLAQNADWIRLCGNDWYELSLQAFRFAEHIWHLPKPLFSNLVAAEERQSFVRSLKAENAECLRRYLKSEHIKGSVVLSDVPGFFHVEYAWDETPLVSIIIPNKDHTDDLKLCLDSLKKSDYKNYEVIIAENNSEDEKTFAFYEALTKEDPKIHLTVWEGPFNYSAINNFAVKSAKGDILLFLNNDTECMESRTLGELVSSVLKPGVGACGAMLYYGDSTIQHAGVIIGMGGFAAHALWSLRDREEAYYPFSLCEREVSAVTGACLMVRRSVFEQVGGMEEDFVVALNDVDLCMKIRAAGYQILFNPYAKLYHYESKSRGYEDTVEKQARFQGEIERFQKKWEKEIKQGDPYYNPNLTLHRADYSMDI